MFIDIHVLCSFMIWFVSGAFEKFSHMKMLLKRGKERGGYLSYLLLFNDDDDDGPSFYSTKLTSCVFLTTPVKMDCYERELAR